jgi:hypothetical protein
MWLFAGSLTVPTIHIELLFQLLVKTVQFIDSIGPTDLSVILFAQPREPLFEQL